MSKNIVLVIMCGCRYKVKSHGVLWDIKKMYYVIFCGCLGVIM